MKKGDELELEIGSLSTEGRGIAKIDNGYVVFVEKTLPGDKVLAVINKIKGSYSEASKVKLVNLSPFRIDAQCSHFGVCGGCKLQDYDYQKQIEFKTKVVHDSFTRIGGFDDIEVPEALGCERIFFYRNKMEFSFSNDMWIDLPPVGNREKEFALGLHVPKFHSKIVDINRCFLQSEISNNILNITRDFFKNKNTNIYSTKTHDGYLRFLVIRQAANTNDLMVNLITSEFDDNLALKYKDEILEKIPQVTTVINSTTASKAQVAFGQRQYVLHGSGYIHEILFNRAGHKIIFKISPNSFFQTNTIQTSVLYNLTEQFAELKPGDNVLDLYCGAGAISIFLAPKVNRVMGIELVEDAVKNAIENKKLNGVANTDFIRSDIKEYLESNSIDGYNKIIIDPPRSGVHPQIAGIISETAFEKIVYVSCNPSTQARDVKIICSQNRYRIEKMQPVDMFPHTYHVENVVVLSRN